MKKLALIFIVFISSNAFSGTLVENAKITHLANISSGADGFYVQVDGSGTGPCSGGSVFFTVGNQPSSSIEALNRAVSIAMLAFTMDLNVQIHNYSSDNCAGASYIRITKTEF